MIAEWPRQARSAPTQAAEPGLLPLGDIDFNDNDPLKGLESEIRQQHRRATARP
jgi:hypothetical protein